MSASESTTSTRTRQRQAARAILVIANPSPDSDSDDGHRPFPVHPQPSPPSPPPPPDCPHRSAPPPKREPEPLNTTNLPRRTHNPSLSNPALSSPGTGTSSPPPTTPAQSLPPTDLVEDHSASVASEHSTESLLQYQSPSHRDSRNQGFFTKVKSHMHFHHRPPHDRRLSSGSSRQPTSPVSSSHSQPYSGRGPQGVRSPHDDKTVIMVTGDSDQYHVVNVTGFETRDAAYIKELIFSKLRIPDEEQPQYSIYRTEVGAFALSQALTDEKLFRICDEEGDSKGNLRFLVASSSAPVHEPTSPTASSVPPPVLPYPSHPSPYLRRPQRSQSRHGSVSSASERIHGDASNGYAPSVSDDMEDESHRSTLRPPPHNTHGANQTYHPSSPQTARNTNPSARPLSPDNRSHSPSTFFPPERVSSNNILSDRAARGPKHAQTGVPLTDHAPRQDDEGTFIASKGYPPHIRSGSDAAADRDRLPRNEVSRVREMRQKGITRENAYVLVDGSGPPAENGRTYKSPPSNKIKASTSTVFGQPPTTPPANERSSRNRQGGRAMQVPSRWVDRTGSKAPAAPTIKQYRSMDALPRFPQPAPPVPSIPPTASSSREVSRLASNNGPVNGESSVKSPRRDPPTSTLPPPPPPLPPPIMTFQPTPPPPPPPPPIDAPHPSSRQGSYTPNVPGGPRAVRPLPQSGAQQQPVQSPDSGYGTYTGFSRGLPLLPTSQGPSSLLSPQNHLDPYTRPSSSLGDDAPPPPPPAPPSYHSHRSAPKPGVFSRPFEEVQSQASTPSHPPRPLPSSHPIPDPIPISPPSQTIRALPVPTRTGSNNPHDQAKPSPPRSPASPKSPQTSKEPRYGPMLDASMSPPNAVLHPPHEQPPQTIAPEDVAYFNSVVKPMLDQQHGTGEDGTVMQTLRPRNQVSLPQIPPPPPLPYELRQGTGIGTGTGFPTGFIPPPPPLHTHHSQSPSSSVPPTPAPLRTNVPRAPGTPLSDDSQSDAGTLWNIRPTAPPPEDDGMTGTNMSTDSIWAAPPMAGTRVSRGPQLTVRIEEGRENGSPQKTSSGGYTTLMPGEVPPMPQGPPPSPPRLGSQRTPTARKPGSSSGSGGGGKQKVAQEAPDSSWASRPNPDEVIERLEQYFPDHDLDKPVIEASSGGTSPTVAELPPSSSVAAASASASAAQLPAIANVQAQDRRKHKKSIRIIARERMSQHPHPKDTNVGADAAANNFARKRSTKLWNSRMEEVTPGQIKAGMAGAPDSPSSAVARQPIFKWVRGELIGKGNFGRVYLAMNVTTGEMIAVKQVEIPRTASDRNDTRQMNVVEALKLESETLKDLDHPNIVQYLGFEETQTFLSIFLEYVPGGSVGGCLRKYGRFEENVTKSFTGQILAGLEYLHSKGILHRDMKADNILVETSGVCKISDFGISKRTDDINNQNVLTAMQGTVFWMAPEVVNTGKRGYNSKVDIWSVGCVVLEMWAGERPWRKEEAMAVIVKLYSSKQAPPIPQGVYLSEEADDFRKLCFAVDPDRRPSAAELRKHPYLSLPKNWTFTGFVRPKDMTLTLEEAETF